MPVAGDTVDSVKFHYVSADMEENFPGNLTADVTISWDDDCNLTFHYQATTDKATVINMTNHTYFNLAGYDHGTVRDHAIYIDSDVVTAVDSVRPAVVMPLPIDSDGRLHACQPNAA